MAGERTAQMTDEEVERWEGYYREACKRDFARMIYEWCDREDAERELAEESQ